MQEARSSRPSRVAPRSGESQRVGPRRTLSLALSFAIALVAPAARADFPTLENVAKLATERSQMILEADGQLNIARSQMAAAKVPILGNPYLEAFATRSRLTENIVLQANLWLPVDTAGQRGARIDEADSLIAWKERARNDSRAAVLGFAIQTYGEIVVARTRIGVAARGEQSARSEVEYFDKRLAQADTTIYEKSIAEAEVARWTQLRAEAELALARSTGRLAELLGRARPELPEENIREVPPPLRHTWDDGHVAAAVAKAPVVMSLEKERLYWSASRERWSTEKYPPVNLILTAGKGEANELVYGGGLSWTFPILRKNQAEVGRAAAEEVRVARVHELVRNTVEARVRTAQRAYETASKAATNLEEVGIPATERAVEASAQGYKLGKVELSRVLLARRDLAIAKSRRLDLVEAAWRAYGELASLEGELP